MNRLGQIMRTCYGEGENERRRARLTLARLDKKEAAAGSTYGILADGAPVKHPERRGRPSLRQAIG